MPGSVCSWSASSRSKRNCPSWSRGTSSVGRRRIRSCATGMTRGSSSTARCRPPARARSSQPRSHWPTIATACDAEGVITMEMFQLPGGKLAVNELAPRVHNSGHWTIEGAHQPVRAAHPRDLRAAARVGGDDRARGGNGEPARRRGGTAGRVRGVEAALRDPGVAVHLYDKRRVFERRKMGHVTAVPTAQARRCVGRAPGGGPDLVGDGGPNDAGAAKDPPRRRDRRRQPIRLSDARTRRRGARRTRVSRSSCAWSPPIGRRTCCSDTPKKPRHGASR